MICPYVRKAQIKDESRKYTVPIILQMNTHFFIPLLDANFFASLMNSEFVILPPLPPPPRCDEDPPEEELPPPNWDFKKFLPSSNPSLSMLIKIKCIFSSIEWKQSFVGKQLVFFRSLSLSSSAIPPFLKSFFRPLFTHMYLCRQVNFSSLYTTWLKFWALILTDYLHACGMTVVASLFIRKILPS